MLYYYVYKMKVTTKKHHKLPKNYYFYILKIEFNNFFYKNVWQKTETNQIRQKKI